VAWQDLLPLGAAIGLLWPRVQSDALYVLPFFLLGYLAALALTLALTGQKYWGYAVAFGMCLTVFLGRDLVGSLTAAIATYALGCIGQRLSLASFPWPDRELLHNWQRWFRLMGAGQASDLQKEKEKLGWPYARLGPQLTGRPKVARIDAFLWGLLVGAWYAALFYHLSVLSTQSFQAREGEVIAMLIMIYLLVFGAAGRIGVYCMGYLPPLSLLGRLAHGRLIIPGYDHVFVAPLLVLLIGAGCGAMTWWTSVPLIATWSISVVLIIWVLLGVGPTLEVWRLTGKHRVTPHGLSATRLGC
jgi:hypothetical protein